ncbi:uncharacterized protein LOC117639925 [Thrips palmi]|uniref:Uncharacterized protein LOC117639925 n=1 Tax=Thrips palmi TaxID=161013 RepID=A0A6P8Y776_THRPL|nr:uncharacterized protein LOC117639925 [Thrips palmi]
MNGLRHCQPLVDTLISSIKKRFKDQLWNRELVVAACLVPMFRLDWIRGTVEEGDNKVYEARAWLHEAIADLAEATEATGELESEGEIPDDPETMDTDNTVVRQLFSFLAPHRPQPMNGPAEELDRFLAEPIVTEDFIKNCKYLKDLFIRSNTCLPASAAVERLFSHAGLVLNPRRTRLADKLFDNLVFLGVNQELLM